MAVSWNARAAVIRSGSIQQLERLNLFPAMPKLANFFREKFVANFQFPNREALKLSSHRHAKFVI
jgi:hypothetical protein